MLQTIEYAVMPGDIFAFDADIIALKYAQAFYGVDATLASNLINAGIPSNLVKPTIDTYGYVETLGQARAKHALFVGAPPLYSFGYPEIRHFASQVLYGVNQYAPATSHLCMTIHGVGYGLDEAESCLAQFEGCLDAIQSDRNDQLLPNLQRISIVDSDPLRVNRLRNAIDDYLSSSRGKAKALKTSQDGLYQLNSFSHTSTTQTLRGGAGSQEEPHVFVAMPFDLDMTDVFYYGIEAPIHSLGFLCERMDHISFTGDIMEWMKRKIETASLVIAEMTGANPNVYLEVGYAWGKGRQTLLVARSGVNLEFDAKGHKCIFYGSIKDLEDKITKEIVSLKAQNLI